MELTNLQTSRNNKHADAQAIEEGDELLLDYTKLKQVANCSEEVIPAVAQDAENGEILIIGYVNEKALKTALSEGKATFWSTSRNELWIKGKTSGDFLELVEMRVNCEQNSILYLVRPAGKGACHTKDSAGNARSGCFYRRINDAGKLTYVSGKQ